MKQIWDCCVYIGSSVTERESYEPNTYEWFFGKSQGNQRTKKTNGPREWRGIPFSRDDMVDGQHTTKNNMYLSQGID